MLPDSGVVQRVISPDTSIELLIPRTVDGSVLGMCIGLGALSLYVLKSSPPDIYCSVMTAATGAVVDELVDDAFAGNADQAVMIEWQGNQYALMATDDPPDGTMILYKRVSGVWSKVSLPGGLTQPRGRALAIFTVAGSEGLYVLCDADDSGERIGKMLRYDGSTLTVDHTFATKTIPRSMLVTEEGLLYLFNEYTTDEEDGVTSLGLLTATGSYDDAYNANALHRAGIALGMRVFDGSIFVAHAVDAATNGKLYRSTDRLVAAAAFEYVTDYGYVLPVGGSAPDCQMAVA